MKRKLKPYGGWEELVTTIVLKDVPKVSDLKNKITQLEEVKFVLGS